jgi:hypothetical protein
VALSAKQKTPYQQQTFQNFLDRLIPDQHNVRKRWPLATLMLRSDVSKRLGSPYRSGRSAHWVNESASSQKRGGRRLGTAVTLIGFDLFGTRH